MQTVEQIEEQTIDKVIEKMNELINGLIKDCGLKFTKDVEEKCQLFIDDVCDIVESGCEEIIELSSNNNERVDELQSQLLAKNNIINKSFDYL